MFGLGLDRARVLVSTVVIDSPGIVTVDRP
jgi:hypothetical protein